LIGDSSSRWGPLLVSVSTAIARLVTIEGPQIPRPDGILRTDVKPVSEQHNRGDRDYRDADSRPPTPISLIAEL